MFEVEIYGRDRGLEAADHLRKAKLAWQIVRQEPQSAEDYQDRTTAAVKMVLVEIGQILGSFLQATHRFAPCCEKA